MAAPSIPPDAVIRVSRGNFDQSRFAEVEQMTRDTGDYLIPAIRQLDGLIGYYAGASPSGSIVHVSLWQSNDHADQMGGLKEMIIDARRDSEAVGVSFVPIINYSIAWGTSAASETDERAVIRVARNGWDPARFDQAAEINERTSDLSDTRDPAARRADRVLCRCLAHRLARERQHLAEHSRRAAARQSQRDDRGRPQRVLGHRGDVQPGRQLPRRLEHLSVPALGPVHQEDVVTRVRPTGACTTGVRSWAGAQGYRLALA
jgi:hypothetical protein